VCLLPGRSTDRNRFPDSDGLHAAAAEDANFGVYESADATPVAFGIVTTDRGDVRELTDASGMPFAFYSYDAYGNPTAKLSAATSLIGADVAAAICSSNVVRYAGYVYDQESGLYYLSARYYDPSTASFLTKDPANADGEESPYQYCGGDPVGKVDPSGEYSLKWISATERILVVRFKELSRRLPGVKFLRWASGQSSAYAVIWQKVRKWYSPHRVYVSYKEYWYLKVGEVLTCGPNLFGKGWLSSKIASAIYSHAFHSFVKVKINGWKRDRSIELWYPPARFLRNRERLL